MITVLIVDDRIELRRVYAALATGEGRDVHVASSAGEASLLIASGKFDVVVTDLQMNQSEAGLEVLRAARRKDPLTQVIVATVFGTPEMSVKAIEMGAFDYLQRNNPAIDFLKMLKYKIDLAARYRRALVQIEHDISAPPDSATQGS